MIFPSAALASHPASTGMHRQTHHPRTTHAPLLFEGERHPGGRYPKTLLAPLAGPAVSDNLDLRLLMGSAGDCLPPGWRWRHTVGVPASAEERLAGLSRSYLFDGLAPGELGSLAAVATTRELVRGEYVWRVGDHAGELYVVLRGEVQDFVLDPGMTVGEPGYFPPNATAAWRTWRWCRRR
jgi:hypothetical protein